MTITDLRQQQFDAALAGVINQGQFSAAKGIDGNYLKGECQYRLNGRADDNVRCGVGHLIPDDVYHLDMEGLDVRALNDDFGLFPESEVDFLDSLQTSHDQALDEGIDGYKIRMKHVAEIYSLTYSE